MAAKADGASKEAQTNPRGIPYAPFVDKVEDYVTTRADVESTLRSFQEMVAKYNFMEENLRRRVAGLKDKMPDIGKTLETVRFLKLQGKKGDAAGEEDELEDEEEGNGKGGKDLETLFELNDTLYAKAKIERDEGSGRVEEVYLWLGANVMLSYPIDEAEELLESKLKAAKTSLRNCEEDLDFLREQITTMEVNVARVYNWDVVQKRKEKEEEEKQKGKKNQGGSDG